MNEQNLSEDSVDPPGSPSGVRALFLDALRFMEAGFRRLETQVPPPKWKPVKSGYHVRYEERTPEQALIQKLARQVSGLYALDLLLVDGLAQEQGVIQRVLDEIGEDIMFLALALINGDWTDQHTAYLEDFWAEEFDHPDPIKATQKRKTVRRAKIHSHNARAGGGGLDPELAANLSTTIHKTYSGFVHAASSHVMDMCGGDPPRFIFKISPTNRRMIVQIDDASNYFYRGIMLLGIVATVFKDQGLWDAAYAYRASFEKSSGKSYAPTPAGTSGR